MREGEAKRGCGSRTPLISEMLKLLLIEITLTAKLNTVCYQKRLEGTE